MVMNGLTPSLLMDIRYNIKKNGIVSEDNIEQQIGEIKNLIGSGPLAILHMYLLWEGCNRQTFLTKVTPYLLTSPKLILSTTTREFH